MSQTQIRPEDLPLLEAQVNEIIGEAKRQGASACEVSVGLSEGLSVSVREGEVETVEFNRDQGFSITLYLGQQKGAASTSQAGSAAIKETVAAALAIARHTSADDCAGLAEAQLMAKELPDLDLWHPWDISAEQAIDRALACEAAAFAADKRISQGDGASVDSWRGLHVYGNSHGFIGSFAGTRHSASCVMIAGTGSEMQRDYWYDSSRVGDGLASAESIGKLAAIRAASRLGARRVPTAQVPVLFSAELAGSLFRHFTAAISGGNLYRHSSFLEGALGQRLFPDWLSIDERPHIPRALGSTAFDDDGLATFDKSLVQDGVLQSYLLGTYSGRKLKLPSTANAGGVHNLLISHGKDDQAALIKRMQRGLLVTELMGGGVNLVTGDYSRGAAGFWVENGEIQFAVQEVTIAAHLRDIFGNIVAIGSDVEKRGTIFSGSVLIEQMTVAGS